MSKEYKEICRKAAEHLKQYGWVQNKYRDLSAREGVNEDEKNYPSCLLGACRYAVGYYNHTIGDNLCVKSDLAVNVAIAATDFALAGNDPIAFNDTPGRTKEEVIALLETYANSPE